ncbi:hypothetical protein GCM10007938_23290 [Vibrio zhanjiangensis]|uniref:Uncharacterized protein n=1 Tax=Vibrio zhanjiangensis TaxID=1046128 RepID=A0ABQ6EZA1_9VIBR|nr:RebB family R body protein [Vibrio zhanjiangensis]GLT18550.1 hypothetical protein GCM10007938_23290 [Vibrio zhanjiangensis]
MNWFLKQAAKRAAKQAAKKVAKQAAKQAAMQAEQAVRKAEQAARDAAMHAIEAPNANPPNQNPEPNTTTSPFSQQGTKLTDSTFADTIGLAMHNAINNQQQSHVTTSATVASTCARILATSVGSPVSGSKQTPSIGKIKPDGLVFHNPKTQ